MKNKIQAEIISAMKERNSVKVSVLKVLKGEIERKEVGAPTPLTEGEIGLIAKKLIESIKEMNGDEREIEVLSKFAPQTMSEEQLKGHIIHLKHELNAVSIKDMGKLMNALAERFKGEYDGKLASNITKNILSE